jgi:hypothetical protein
MVNSSKEGNTSIVYHPIPITKCIISSDKEFKITRKGVNAPRLALCCRRLGICSTNVKVETVLDRWNFSWWGSFFFDNHFFFVFYICQ